MNTFTYLKIFTALNTFWSNGSSGCIRIDTLQNSEYCLAPPDILLLNRRTVDGST